MALFKPGKDQLPEFIKQYQNSFRHKLDKTIPVEKISFAVIDTETTGPVPARDSMISFAGLSIHDLKISVQDSMELMIMKQSNLNDNGIHIHEITSKERSRGVEEKEALIKILGFLSGKVITGFNIQFDIKILNNLLGKAFKTRLLNPKIEINDLASRIDHPVKKIYPSRQPDLKDLCEQFDVPLEDHHTAAGDVFATAQLFIKLVTKLKKRGVATWGDLRKTP